MTSYLLATGAAWLAASVIAVISHRIVSDKSNESAAHLRLDEITLSRRKPLLLLGRLAFVLMLVYLLRWIAPVSAHWQIGLQLGALAGALINLPLAFEQFARLPFSPRKIISSALSGIVESAVAGVAAALALTLNK